MALYLSATHYVSCSLYVPRAITMLQVTDRRTGGKKAAASYKPAGGNSGAGTWGGGGGGEVGTIGAARLPTFLWRRRGRRLGRVLRLVKPAAEAASHGLHHFVLGPSPAPPAPP